MNDNLAEISDMFVKAMKAIQDEEDTYWNSLTKEQQLLVFCAVVRRICKGEFEDKGTYRYILYETFGFGPESYARAQMAGFLNLHNRIE